MDNCSDLDKFALIKELIDVGAIKFGHFFLKSGKTSDLYFDMRQLYGHQKLMTEISQYFIEFIFKNTCNPKDLICGVPMGAIPLASIISYVSNAPLILVRDKKKDYGMQNLIEGIWEKGQPVYIIEDVTTTGGSINECCDILESHGLKVVDKLVIIDRTPDHKFNSLLTEADIRQYLSISKIPKRVFENSTAQKLWKSVIQKRTNICLSLDVYTTGDICNYLRLLGDHICMVKFHWDIVDKSINLNKEDIYELAKEKNVMILDDRKYNDIDSIVCSQYCKSPKSNAVTVQPQFGQGTINGLTNNSLFQDSGIFLIAQSSAKGNLIRPENTKDVIDLALANSKVVAGLITQDVTEQSLLNLTPGINLDLTEEGFQGYTTPKQAVKNGSDILIVGRGIYRAEDPVKECIRYKQEGFNALLSRYKID